MFNSVNEALDNAKRHGLSTAEVLQGYRNERTVPTTCKECDYPCRTLTHDLCCVCGGHDEVCQLCSNQQEATYSHICEAR
jgi:hypothetical protein